jgi:hypothetical protein
MQLHNYLCNFLDNGNIVSGNDICNRAEINSFFISTPMIASSPTMRSLCIIKSLGGQHHLFELPYMNVAAEMVARWGMRGIGNTR